MSQNALHPTPTVGERVELARYTVSGGERILYGQRINGVVRVTDRPAGRPGRSYLIERGLEHDGYAALKALVADYTSQAEQLDEIPMAVSLVRHTSSRKRREPRAARTGAPGGCGRLPLSDLRTLRVRDVGQRPRTRRGPPQKERHEHRHPSSPYAEDQTRERCRPTTSASPSAATATREARSGSSSFVPAPAGARS